MKKHTLVAMAFALAMALFIPSIQPLKASAATFADGEYSVPFTVLKDNSNEVSTTADYMVSPAKVQLTNDQATVTVTLKNSSWWQYFKVQNGGSYSDVQVVSESGDQRVVRFTVSDLTSLVNAKIHIIVTGIPGFNYDNKYDIRFNFNTTSIPAPPVEKPVTTPPPAKETKPETPKKTEVKKTEEKPVQKQAEKAVAQKTETAKKTETVTKTEEKSSGNETEKEETGLSVTEPEEAEQETVTDDEAADATEAQEAQEAEDAANTDVALDDLNEENEEDEVTEEVAVEEVKDEKEDSSNGLFIFITVLTAIIVAAIVFVLARKRARK